MDRLILERGITKLLALGFQSNNVKIADCDSYTLSDDIHRTLHDLTINWPGCNYARDYGNVHYHVGSHEDFLPFLEDEFADPFNPTDAELLLFEVEHQRKYPLAFLGR